VTAENSRQAQLEEKRRSWKQHVEDWRSSDLTRADYCRRHDLSYDRFIYWKRKFQPGSSPAFIELKLPAVPYPKMLPRESSLRVAVSRFQISVDPGFDPAVLRDLVHTLERL
jgi:hypothetical protein